MPAATLVRRALVNATSVTLLVGGCGSGGGCGSADAAKSFSYQVSEPQNPVQPANANEAGGSRIILNLFKGLVGLRPGQRRTADAGHGEDRQQ
ncbi:hypothetical protein GCM10010495_76030 [Kitasatospora herbaricolor]|nr:hypothetical protein GCM10010495_76030 [Kitasatospora herbaricolor]